MLALIAVFVIVVAVLLCNDFHLKFSCHEIIISYFGNNMDKIRRAGAPSVPPRSKNRKQVSDFYSLRRPVELTVLILSL